MLLECLDSDADASVVVVLLQWLNQLQNFSRDTTKYSPLSRNETKTRLHYTQCVVLNDCVSARWSPMCQYLALTSLRDSHRLPTRHIREPGTDRWLFFSLPYFRFCTSVSALRFLFQRFPLAHTLTMVELFAHAQTRIQC